MNARTWRLLPAAFVAIAACSSWKPAKPVVTAVTPATVTLDVPTPVTIEGRRFRNDLDASLDSGGTRVDDTWSATVAGVSLTDVVRVNDTALNAVVPAGVPLGVHDLEVVSPSGDRAVLPGGLTIVEEVTGTLEGPAVDAPGTVAPAQEWVRLTMTFTNTFTRSFPLVAARLDFANPGDAAADDYVVYADIANPVEIAALSSARLVFWVNVDPAADGFGDVDVLATARAALSTNGEWVDLAGATSWALVDEVPPAFTLDPLSSSERTLCVGSSATVAVSGAASAFTWELEGGTPATATGTSATATWNEPGPWFYSVTGTDSAAIANTQRTIDPIFVGALSRPPSKTHATGPLLFDRPLTGEALDLATLSAGDDVRATQFLAQCDGTPLENASQNDYVTVFVDRGALDPAEDDRSNASGVQRDFVADVFPATTLAPGAYGFEGPATLYAETRDSDDHVTGATRIPFSFVGDVVPPAIAQSVPAADCGAACLAPGDALWFRLSEPLDVATLSSGISVSWSPGVACGTTAGFSATTADVAWDEQAWTIAITPPAVGPAATWTVRAQLAVTDTAVAANPLSSTLCAVFDGGAAPVPAAPTAVTLDVMQFSPDGDASADAVTFTFDAPAGASRARLEIWRDYRRVATVVRPVAGPVANVLAWDGRDGNGRVVRDGWVEWRLFLENAAGAASPAITGTLQVESGVSWIGPPFPVP